MYPFDKIRDPSLIIQFYQFQNRRSRTRKGSVNTGGSGQAIRSGYDSSEDTDIEDSVKVNSSVRRSYIYLTISSTA